MGKERKRGTPFEAPTGLKVETWVGGQIFEVKQTEGGVYPSSYNDQILGHINNLGSKFNSRITPQNPNARPVFVLVTTGDVPYSPAVNRTANENLVKFQHLKAKFKIVNNKYIFKFEEASVSEKFNNMILEKEVEFISEILKKLGF